MRISLIVRSLFARAVSEKLFSSQSTTSRFLIAGIMLTSNRLLRFMPLSPDLTDSRPLHIYLDDLFRCENKKNCLVVSLHRFSTESADNSDVNFLQSLHHPFMLFCFNCIDTAAGRFLVTEDCRVSLKSCIKQPMREEHIKRIFGQLILAVQYLHSEKLHIAGSINLDSIYLDRHGNVRLSVIPRQLQPLSFKAPELLMESRETEGSDIWSLGIVLYAIAASRMPFDDINSGRLTAKIMHDDPVFPVHFSGNLTNLLERMLTKDPGSRITLSNIKLHPFFSDMSLTESGIQEFSTFLNDKISDEVELTYDFSAVSILSNLTGDFNREGVIQRLLHRERQTIASSLVQEQISSIRAPAKSKSRLQCTSSRKLQHMSFSAIGYGVL
jgi:serine/threonine protein kinase